MATSLNNAAQATMPRVHRSWPIAAGLFACASLIYGLTAVALGRTQSPFSAYYNLLADAFLHGRLYLASPSDFHDLTLHNGRWYVAFPPLPALLMLPWVALAGLARTNTVLFSVLTGALNVALAYLLLQALARRGWSRLSAGDNLWLTALFGVGSVHWYMSTIGSVWFLAQICAASFMLLAIWRAAAGGSALGAGTLLGLAMLGRPHMALCYPLLLAIGIQGWREQASPPQPAARLAWALGALAPLLAAAGLLLAYNAARFGSALDFGYSRQQVDPTLASDLRRYGQFSLHYLPHNLWSMLLAGPIWDATRQRILPSVDGMSLLLTTPALLYLARAWRRSPLALGAWLALGLLLLPLITYYNTGWWQFGYRFSLDVMPPALVLLAIGAGERASWRMRGLILAGVAVNAWGAWWFLNTRYF